MTTPANPSEFPELIPQKDLGDADLEVSSIPQLPEEIFEEQEQEQEQETKVSIPDVTQEAESGLNLVSAPAITTVAKKPLRQKTKPGSIYSQAVITRRVTLNMNNVGRTLKQNLEKLIASEVEGKCIVEGFIKPQSTRLLTYNSGLIKNGEIVFEVVFECMACCPVEGMLIDCVAKNITKAGIRAEIDAEISPVVVFVARDHNHLSDYFSSINENDTIKVRVIGQRFELNDKYVSIIAQIVQQKEQPESRKVKSKPKLVFPKQLKETIEE